MKTIKRIFTFITLAFMLSSTQTSFGMLTTIVRWGWRLPAQQHTQETPQPAQPPQTHLDYLLQTTVPRVSWQNSLLSDDDKNALSVALHCDIARLASIKHNEKSEVTMPSLTNHIIKTQEHVMQRALAAQKEKYKQEIQELNNRIDTLQNNQDKKQEDQEISNLKNKILELKQKLAAAEQTTHNQKNEAESVNATLQNDLNTKTDQINRLKSENQNLNVELEKEKNRYQLGLAVGMLAVGGLGGYLFAHYWK